MDFSTLPKTAVDFVSWKWEQIEPYFADLQSRSLTKTNIRAWLLDWTRIAELMDEAYFRLYIATTVNTKDEEAEKRHRDFAENIRPKAQEAEQKLREKLLAVPDFVPEDFGVSFQKMQWQAEIFREENLPLLAEDIRLGTEHNKIIGAQTVQWEGKELTIAQLQPIYQDPDRARREKAWRLSLERQLQDKEKIDNVWIKMLTIRNQIGRNAGLPDYRAYKFKEMLRFDYTPEECLTFHQAIEEVVVPAAERVYERRRKRLGLDSVRPWDTTVDPFGRPALKPYQTIDELLNNASVVFQKVDPVLGGYFDVMRRENLLDLDNRPNKAPGAYNLPFEAAHVPFIFGNSVGIHDDVVALFHESGHAFHTFETSGKLPYIQQRGEVGIPIEFAEVASMAMELLASPYMPAAAGGFYTGEEYARAMISHLEGIITFWPYMAVLDAYQHWVYTHIDEAMNPDACDATWVALWRRFMSGVDWSELDDAIKMRWRRQLHPFSYPFYYVEYGLAQLGAVQVWRNALKDQSGAVAAYRRALALGGSKPLPELYQTAGAKFAFDSQTMHTAVGLLEEQIEKLEAKL